MFLCDPLLKGGGGVLSFEYHFIQIHLSDCSEFFTLKEKLHLRLDFTCPTVTTCFILLGVSVFYVCLCIWPDCGQ